jgi:hypothetical protein
MAARRTCEVRTRCSTASLALWFALAAPAAADVVAHFDRVTADTINASGHPVVTAPERRPFIQGDLAAIHVAMYDAAVAVEGGFRPFAAKNLAAARGASVDAAVASAACAALEGLFPSRAPIYAKPCGDYLGAIADGEAKSRGVAVGRDAARAVVALRLDDGRSPARVYAPADRPGTFQPTALPPIGEANAVTAPFTLERAAQFRPAGPPALASAAYAADFAEVKARGVAGGTSLTSDQQEMARFHTEPPHLFLPRNVRRFVDDRHGVLRNARLMAMTWVALADATIACFEAKYHYDFWRPRTAIPQAGSDGNDATAPDPGWQPFVPSPNHPEYPAAHGCSAGAIAAALRGATGGERIGVEFDSAATQTKRRYEYVDDLVRDFTDARIFGGMHFRTSVDHGTALGLRVGRWVAERHFQPMDGKR